MKKIISLIVFVLFVSVVLFYGQDVYKEFKKTFQKNKIEKKVDNQSEDIFTKFTTLDFAKNSEKISYEDFMKGFWYEKDGDLFYFNLEELIKKGYTKEDILRLIESIKNSRITKSQNIKYIAEEDLPEDIQFYNKLNVSGSLSAKLKYKDIKSQLENKKNKTASDFSRLSQIYSLEGQYKKAEEMNKKACLLDKKFCITQTIKITGNIVDQYNKPVEGVTIKSAADNSIRNKTDGKGNYVLEIKLTKFNKDRLIIEKFGYATTFQSIVSVSENQTKYKVPKTTLYKGKYIYSVDNIKNIVNNDGVFKDNNFILKTNHSTYTIPKNSFYTKEGREYKGKLKVSLFEFDRKTVPSSLISLDSFSEQSGLLGTFMITFGMPYIIIQTEKGDSLYVLKKNPMTLVYNSGSDEIIKNIPKNELNQILEKSKEGKYYYTAENISKKIVNLVPFWCLDQKTGVWDNTGFDLLDNKGTLRAKFYTSVK